MNNLQSKKVIAINVIVTFIQGALAAWAVSGNQLTKQALTGAAAAGASVVWNIAIKPALKTNNILYK